MNEDLVINRENVQSSYLSWVYDVEVYGKVIEELKELILSSNVEFEAIAFSGQSGSAIAYPLSLMLKKPIVNVRKQNDNCHFGKKVEGFINFKKYIIVDDLVNEGETIKYIVSKIKTLKSEPKCNGIFFVKRRYNIIEDNIKKYSLMYSAMDVQYKDYTVYKMYKSEDYSKKRDVDNSITIDKNIMNVCKSFVREVLKENKYY